MLFLTRTPGQGLALCPEPVFDLTTPVAVLFANGPIRAQVVSVQGERVCLGVAAPLGLSFVRDAFPPVGEGEAPGTMSDSARMEGARMDSPARELLMLYDELTALHACHAFVTQALAASVATVGWTNARPPGRYSALSGWTTVRQRWIGDSSISCRWRLPARRRPMAREALIKSCCRHAGGGLPRHA